MSEGEFHSMKHESVESYLVKGRAWVNWECSAQWQESREGLLAHLSRGVIPRSSQPVTKGRNNLIKIDHQESRNKNSEFHGHCVSGIETPSSFSCFVHMWNIGRSWISSIWFCLTLLLVPHSSFIQLSEVPVFLFLSWLFLVYSYTFYPEGFSPVPAFRLHLVVFT